MTVNEYNKDGSAVYQEDTRSPIQQRLDKAAQFTESGETVSDNTASDSAEPGEVPSFEGEDYDEYFWSLPRDERHELGMKWESREQFEKAIGNIASKRGKQESVTEAAGVTPDGGVAVVGNEAKILDRLADIRASGQAAINPALRDERKRLMAELESISPMEHVDVKGDTTL